MTKALTTVDFLAAHEEVRPAMNPASIIWPEWPRERDEDATVTAMVPRAKRRRDDGPVVILNKDWKPTV